ncbi:peroxiredoxin family protein [Planctomyces sp. SH-PL14]|uniref:peroxiredoxin family protein n=1 Tax=Planctomyces sp. SH-PL14 TaxID=1632864 RepID=UPI00078E8C45|nr:peroxiredoxin family protein [Planctomyces sp. SH-PL14]AMV21407.1 Putative peroxiredoxin [Planctomyces sp. SH-PL14]
MQFRSVRRQIPAVCAWSLLGLAAGSRFGLADDAKKPDTAPTAAAAETSTPNGPLPGHSYHGEVFDEGPRQKGTLLGTSGTVSFPATSAVADVQAFVNQGVAQLHGFWYLEAERSFRQAAMLDPDCAIAYWGMAMANTENAKRAAGFIAEAVKRREKASRREQLYIDGLSEFLKSSPEAKSAEKKEDAKKDETAKDGAKETKSETAESAKPADKKPPEKLTAEQKKEKERERRQKLADSFEKIVSEFPDDLEAKAFLALHLWQSRTKGLPMHSPTALNALLQEVIAASPMHPCHHYVIHLWDEKEAKRALKSAAMGGPSAPGIAHMWHMPGHTYSKLHRYHDAAWQQEASARVDHAHMMRAGLLPDQIHNFAHNNEWLIRNLIHNGDAHAAVALAKNMIDLPRHPKWNTIDDGGSSAFFGRVRLYDVLQQFEMGSEVLRLESTRYLEPVAKEADERRRQSLIAAAAFQTGDGLRGSAILTDFIEAERKLRDERDAAVQKAKDEAAKANKKSEEIEKAGQAAAGKFDGKISALQPFLYELKGQLHLAHRAYGDALTAFEKSGRADKGLLAVLQVRAGQTEKGIETARKNVADNPKETIPLVRQVEALSLAGKKDEARKAFDELKAISSMAALDTPLFGRLRPFLADLGAAEDWRVALEPAKDLGERPPLDTLGPAHWSPSPAPSWELADHRGTVRSLASYRGRPVVVLFYLGHGCLHCVEQLQKFAAAEEEFEKWGVGLIAIGTDDPASLQLACKSYGSEFPFPLVSNSSLDVFKTYRCYDDFESQPLHGSFLIDADGLVRWQDISAEPFVDTKFLLEETKRLLGTP